MAGGGTGLPRRVLTASELDRLGSKPDPVHSRRDFGRANVGTPAGGSALPLRGIRSGGSRLQRRGSVEDTHEQGRHSEARIDLEAQSASCWACCCPADVLAVLAGETHSRGREALRQQRAQSTPAGSTSGSHTAAFPPPPAAASTATTSSLVDPQKVKQSRSRPRPGSV